MNTKDVSFRRALRGLMYVAVAAVLAGCGATSTSPPTVTPGQAPLTGIAEIANSNGLQAPAAFPWAGQVLEATGEGKPTAGMRGPQASLSARSSARIAALNQVKKQLRQLPVGSDQTVGSVMDTYLAVRIAVEKEWAAAETLGEQPGQDGALLVTVRLPLQRIADLLQQYAITPDQELPPAPKTEVGGVPAYT